MLFNNGLKMEITLEQDANLRNLLETIAEKVGRSFVESVYDPGSQRLSNNVILLVNRRVLRDPQELDELLSDGDRVDVFSGFVGG